MKRFDAETVTIEVALAPPCDGGKEAMIVTGPPIATAVTLKEAETAPEAIDTLCGTVATAVFDDVKNLQIIPVNFDLDGQRFRYFSAVTVLGSSHDITVQELRIETFFPVDAETSRAARELASGGH